MQFFALYSNLQYTMMYLPIVYVIECYNYRYYYKQCVPVYIFTQKNSTSITKLPGPTAKLEIIQYNKLL